MILAERISLSKNSDWGKFTVLESDAKKLLHVGRPNIGDQTILHQRLDQILHKRWLTNNGRMVGELEERIADYHQVKHCITTCNGTMALEIAIKALGLTGEVILPSFTFIATAHILQWQGMKPVFCDIDPATHNIDPERVESVITPRTTGIIGVHVWGRPCDTQLLSQIAENHGLHLIFDAAHAFACSHNGRMVGSFGDCEIFSFHATKFFNTFEGGAVVTNNTQLAEKIRLMRNFGFAGMDNVVSLGINGKMNEICAAMGLTNMESLDEFIDINRRNFYAYRAHIETISGLQLVTYSNRDKNNFHYIVVEVDETTTGISRDDLVSELHARNIRARRYFYPGCHRMEPYRRLYPNTHTRLLETEALCHRVMVLPTGSTINEETIKHICRILRNLVQNA